MRVYWRGFLCDIDQTINMLVRQSYRLNGIDGWLVGLMAGAKMVFAIGGAGTFLSGCCGVSEILCKFAK